MFSNSVNQTPEVPKISVGSDAALFQALIVFGHTYLRSWALLEEPPIVQPLKNPPAFYGTRSFNTVFTRALQWSLS
jgi:hypothetical protein